MKTKVKMEVIMKMIMMMMMIMMMIIKMKKMNASSKVKLPAGLNQPAIGPTT